MGPETPSDPARGISWRFATKIYVAQSNFEARPRIRPYSRPISDQILAITLDIALTVRIA